MGQPCVFERHGVWEFPKAVHATDQAWTNGGKLYWDATNNVLTVTAAGNTLVANAAAAVGSTVAVGRAVLRPVAG